MRLRLALDEKMMDVRVRDRLLADGKITQKEVQDYLAALGDDESNLERLGKEDTSTAE